MQRVIKHIQIGSEKKKTPQNTEFNDIVYANRINTYTSKILLKKSKYDQEIPSHTLQTNQRYHESHRIPTVSRHKAGN